MTEGHTERLETALDGKYRIERKLGEGGMATGLPGRGHQAQAQSRAQDPAA